MTLKRPLLMQAAVGDTAISYSALDVRALLGMLLRTEGILHALTPGTGALKVSQRGAGANFSVDVAAGAAVISGDDVSSQGMYAVESTAVENLTVPSPPVSGTRVHRVIARLKDHLHDGSWPVNTYEWTLEVLADTGSGTPALPASAINLATVSVAAGQPSVLDADITDLRVVALLGPSRSSRVTASDRPQNPSSGERVWRADTKVEEQYEGTWKVAFEPGKPEPQTAVSIDAGTTTSTSFTTTLSGAGSNVSTVFTASASGKALVTASAYMRTDTAFLDAIFGARITLTSGGATVYTPANEECAKTDTTTNTTPMGQYIVTGLTPGTSYTAVGVHKVESGATGAYDDRRITVQPI